jgi:hypothetical protein
MKTKKVIIFVVALIYFFITLGLLKVVAQDGSRSKKEIQDTTTSLKKDSLLIHWIPQNQILPIDFINKLVFMNINNASFNVFGEVIPGACFEIKFYGKNIKIAAIREESLPFEGLANIEISCILLNIDHLRFSYDCIRNFLIQCSLQNIICDESDYIELAFIHEFWHLINSDIDIKKQEYYVEYQALNSRIKYFYLTGVFLGKISADKDYFKSLNDKYNGNYTFIHNAYKNVFDINYQIDNIPDMVVKYNDLIKKYGFDGLIQKYKDFAKKLN